MSENETFAPEEEKNQPTPWFEQDGERIYGEAIREVEPGDLDNFVITPESLLHIIRHLVGLSADMRTKLVGVEIQNGDEVMTVDDAFLNAQLSTTGSKFDAKLQDPEDMIKHAKEWVLDQLKNGKQVKWFKGWQKGQQIAKFFLALSAEQKAELGLDSEEKLGTSGVIPISSEIADQVKREMRGEGEESDRIIVNVIDGIPTPRTDSLMVWLKRKDGSDEVEFYTMYTGIMTPALPRKGEQPDDEFEYNKEWWGKHVFVK